MSQTATNRISGNVNSNGSKPVKPDVGSFAEAYAEVRESARIGRIELKPMKIHFIGDSGQDVNGKLAFVPVNPNSAEELQTHLAKAGIRVDVSIPVGGSGMSASGKQTSDGNLATPMLGRIIRRRLVSVVNPLVASAD